MRISDWSSDVCSSDLLTAEQVATQWKVSREDQDAFALQSHQRALAAQQAGEFTDEILPIDVVRRTPNLHTGKVTEQQDRKSVVWGKSGSVRVDLGGRRNNNKKQHNTQH